MENSSIMNYKTKDNLNILNEINNNSLDESKDNINTKNNIYPTFLNNNDNLDNPNGKFLLYNHIKYIEKTEMKINDIDFSFDQYKKEREDLQNKYKEEKKKLKKKYYIKSQILEQKLEAFINRWKIQTNEMTDCLNKNKEKKKKELDVLQHLKTVIESENNNRALNSNSFDKKDNQHDNISENKDNKGIKEERTQKSGDEENISVIKRKRSRESDN